ncbi:hypothetical protein CEXT_323361 [Caerostris extrusa]|uniref:Uncharacterized protein n=1 Tax=Caerostris extrusa TaxID=172846 RepID=A0AAV4WZY1_CAEEX|nr:hypothetical protein CEXT_323361 [Caerostris extrusa]
MVDYSCRDTSRHLQRVSNNRILEQSHPYSSEALKKSEAYPSSSLLQRQKNHATIMADPCMTFLMEFTVPYSDFFCWTRGLVPKPINTCLERTFDRYIDESNSPNSYFFAVGDVRKDRKRKRPLYDK